MAVIYSASFVRPSQFLPDSTDTGSSVNFLSTLLDPWLGWRATGLGSSHTLVVDFGATTALAALVLDNLTTALVTIEGHASNSWGSPSFSDAAIAVSQDRTDDRYKLYRTLSSFNYRFMRLRTTSTATVDSSRGFGFGTFAALSAVSDFPALEFPVWDRVDPANEHPKAGGNASHVSLGKPFAQITIGQQYLREAEKAGFEALGQRGRHLPFVWYENLGDSSRVYICRRSGPFGLARGSASYLRFGGIVLRGS